MYTYMLFQALGSTGFRVALNRCLCQELMDNIHMALLGFMGSSGILASPCLRIKFQGQRV